MGAEDGARGQIRRALIDSYTIKIALRVSAFQPGTLESSAPGRGPYYALRALFITIVELNPFRQPSLKRGEQIEEEAHAEEVICHSCSFPAILGRGREDTSIFIISGGPDPDSELLPADQEVVSKITNLLITVVCLGEAYKYMLIMALETEITLHVLGEILKITIIP